MILDAQLFKLLNGLAGISSLSDKVILFLADYLAYVMVVLIVVIAFFSDYSRRERLQFILIPFFSAFLSRGIVEIIRFIYHRPRPFLAFHIRPLIPEGSYSFPSGHAAFFFALAMGVYLFNKKWGAWFFLLSILMGVARVMAGVHYISDILGGAALGVLVGYLTFKANQKYKLI